MLGNQVLVNVSIVHSIHSKISDITFFIASTFHHLYVSPLPSRMLCKWKTLLVLCTSLVLQLVGIVIYARIKHKLYNSKMED